MYLYCVLCWLNHLFIHSIFPGHTSALLGSIQFSFSSAFQPNIKVIINIPHTCNSSSSSSNNNNMCAKQQKYIATFLLLLRQWLCTAAAYNFQLCKKTNKNIHICCCCQYAKWISFYKHFSNFVNTTYGSGNNTHTHTNTWLRGALTHTIGRVQLMTGVANFKTKRILDPF